MLAIIYHLRLILAMKRDNGQMPAITIHHPTHTSARTRATSASTAQGETGAPARLATSRTTEAKTTTTTKATTKTTTKPPVEDEAPEDEAYWCGPWGWRLDAVQARARARQRLRLSSSAVTIRGGIA